MEKKLFSITILSLMAGVICFSQNVNLNSAISYFDGYEKYNEVGSLPKAKEKIELAAANEATRSKYKTWYYRGQILLATFDQSLKAAMSNSTEPDINKKIVTAYSLVPMEDIDEALKSFQKEIELDDKNVYVNEANAKIKVIANHYSDKAYASLANQNYAVAMVFYNKSFEMKLKMGVTDTAAANNMAISAMKLKDYKKAEVYYGKLIEMKYKPERCYLTLIQMYTDAGDTASVRKIIVKAVSDVPTSYALLIEQINLSLKDGKSEAAINSIHQALVKNPNNPELHLVLGQTYNKMAFPKDIAGNKDLKRPADFTELVKKAEEEFIKTIEIKKDYLVGLYSAGIFYNNIGADILKQSENMKDPKKIKAEEDKADELFKKAIPLLEKAHELDPGDKDTMRTLKQLYARTGQGDTEKYKKLNEELKK
jgi:tetratricopeptide (TPR) repeat protein